MAKLHQQTLVFFKPDAINRGILGEIITRFERKGLKVVAMKMMNLNDKLINKHYQYLTNKPFFKNNLVFFQSTPVVIIILEGLEAVKTVRNLAGPTYGVDAPAGTIRGDYSVSTRSNIIHASDSIEGAKKKIERFFKISKIFDYKKFDHEILYSEDER